MRHGGGQGLKGGRAKGRGGAKERGALMGLWGCGAEMWGWGIYGAEI